MCLFLSMRFIYILLIVFLIFSCSSKKNILYIQESDNFSKTSTNYSDYKLKIDDILKIEISSENPESLISSSDFNTPKSFNNREMMMFDGYSVDSNGKIYISSLGSFNILGLTIQEVKLKIEKRIVETGFLTSSNVDVKMLNSQFTVIGEVNSPGRYFYDQNNLNILEAIGMAGDLTINGNRDDIKIIRETNQNQIIHSVDITTTNFLTSDKYQIISGDIIVVNPNNSRVKNAGIIGNSGTLLSLLTFILSSIIVISN